MPSGRVSELNVVSCWGEDIKDGEPADVDLLT